MKKSVALILSFLFVLFFSACNKENNSDSREENLTVNADAEFESIENSESESSSEIVTVDDSYKDDDPSQWSKEEIVDFYKKAATLSHPTTKSQHKINIKDISVNNGEFEGLFNFITPIMSKLLANNSSDKDGITGGYQNLTADDVASAKAYKSGSNTVIELIMKKQVSGAKEDALSGSVGHAITAVGDISDVIKQMEELGLPLEISDKNTEIIYTNPTVKVVINEKGIIVNGTWKYTVAINLNDYKAFGKKVDTTSVIMDNILTVNGGFKK